MVTQNKETIQAVKAIVMLKRAGIVKTEAELSRLINYIPQSINQVKTGKRNLPPEIITRMISVFELNQSFIFQEQLPVFLPEGKYGAYNVLVEPADKDIHTRLKELESNQKIILQALKKQGLI